MLNEQTHQKLVHLKLLGMASAFQDYLDQRKPDGLSFEERFGMMVDREWDERQQRRIRVRLSRAQLREPASIEDIDFRHPRGLDRSVIQRLSTCQWVANHENILLTGAAGLGKTWLACALANKACREGYSSLYTRVPRLLPSLQIAHADGTYERQLARLAKTDIVILDDWGLSALTDAERRDVLEIIEDRHGRRSTIVAGQVPVANWHELIGEPTVADAILDRLLSGAHRIDLLTGPSIRKGRPKDSDA